MKKNQSKQAAQDGVTVFCVACGAELRRIVDPKSDPGRACYRWLTPAGATADNCPGCGAVTSKLTTTPASDVKTDLDEAAIFSNWRAKLRQLPASDRVVIEMLIDRLLSDVRNDK